MSSVRNSDGEREPRRAEPEPAEPGGRVWQHLFPGLERRRARKAARFDTEDAPGATRELVDPSRLVKNREDARRGASSDSEKPGRRPSVEPLETGKRTSSGSAEPEPSAGSLRARLAAS